MLLVYCTLKLRREIYFTVDFFTWTLLQDLFTRGNHFLIIAIISSPRKVETISMKLIFVETIIVNIPLITICESWSHKFSPRHHLTTHYANQNILKLVYHKCRRGHCLRLCWILYFRQQNLSTYSLLCFMTRQWAVDSHKDVSLHS